MSESPGVSGLFAFTVLLSAFLLFAVQPLAGRYILPWLGGGAGVWSVCLVFFQAGLVTGYGYAHVVARLRRGPLVHLALLGVSLLLMPARPRVAGTSLRAEHPALDVLELLVTSVGLPYVLLCATAPLLLYWHSERRGFASYRLYALSNAGSLLALVSYPLVVEPLLGREAQVDLWSALFGLFALASGIVAWRARASDARGGNEPTEPRPRVARALLWVALSASPAALLVAVTAQLSSDVAAVPLLWIIPLAIYLLTFIIAFGRRRAGSRPALLIALAMLAPLVVAALFEDHIISLQQEGLVLGTALFVCCLLCHGELARTKPAPAHLTGFFLLVAFGGALGGAFAGLLAPALFDGFWELHLSFLLCTALVVGRLWVDSATASRARRAARWAATLATVVLALALASHTTAQRRDIIAVDRNFYGVVRVQERVDASGVTRRTLLHGFVNHGSQHFTAAGPSRVPTTYFSAETGVVRVLAEHPRRREGGALSVLVIGLGVGTLAAWGQPGDTFDFIELNPAVERLARTHFTYLADSRARTSVTLGDGRRVVAAGNERGRAAAYGVIVLDAFTGDAVPLHLLTIDAARVFCAALASDGVLAFNITNRFVDLEPVVRGIAEDAGATLVIVESGDDDGPSDLNLRARWALVVPEELAVAGTLGQPAPPGPSLRWSDDDTSLVQVLR